MTEFRPITPLTIQSYLNNSASLYCDCPSLAFVGEKPLTYKELKDAVTDISNKLYMLGIEPGDKVAIIGQNSPNWGISYLAITTYGAIAVPLLPDFSPSEIETILNHAEPKGLFVSDKIYQKVKDINIPSIEFIFRVEDFSLKMGSFISDKNIENRQEYIVKEEDTASIIYTSGTTGRSKGVELSHKNITWTAQQSYNFHPIESDDVFLSILPLSHVLESTISFIYPIRQGASIYYLAKQPSPSVLMQALATVKPTTMLSVPLIMEKIYKSKILPTFSKNKFVKYLYSVPVTKKILNRIAGKQLYQNFGGRMKFYGIGGAKLDVEVERFLAEAKFPYAIGYGLTETAPLLAGAPPFKTSLQSTGAIVSGLDLRIDNPDPNTGIGEIIVKGPNVMKGYYKEPELTKSAFTADGYYRTGDLGLIDSRGYLYIKGRLKNMILGASGENIYPEDIESLINNEEFVVESLVIEKKGRLVAMVHFNYEELEKYFIQLKQEANQLVDEKILSLKEKYEDQIETLTEKYNQQKEIVSTHVDKFYAQYNDFLEELKKRINSKLNKFSQLSQLEMVEKPFEKTATQKIKRYLYTSSNHSDVKRKI